MQFSQNLHNLIFLPLEKNPFDNGIRIKKYIRKQLKIRMIYAFVESAKTPNLSIHVLDSKYNAIYCFMASGISSLCESKYRY